MNFKNSNLTKLFLFSVFSKEKIQEISKVKEYFEVFNLINAKLNLFVNMLYLVNDML